MNTKPVPIRVATAFRRILLVFAYLASAGAWAAASQPALPPLDTDGQPHPGKLVWADLVTDNIPAAQTFYAQLFGWTFTASGNDSVAASGGRPLGGLYHRARPKDSPGRPRWIGYFSVTSVPAAQQAVTAAGGKVVLAARQIPARGEQVVFADPEGALFGAIKTSAGDPPDCLPDPGEWIWMQLLSGDARKAADFYQTVSGCEVVDNAGAGHADSLLLISGGYARAAVRTIPAQFPQVKPTWLPFVRVAHVAATVAQAKQLGGAVLIEPSPGLLDGKVAVIADPTGAAIGLLEWNGETTN